MKDTPTIRKIAFVGDYLPRKCGIATFTADLLSAVASAHQALAELYRAQQNVNGAVEEFREALDVIRRAESPWDALHAALQSNPLAISLQSGHSVSGTVGS